MRDVLFISHANPEDNAFSRWLALQLAAEGYAVWCDQTMNLVGADIWRDVDPVLDEQTVKFLFVLSKSSNDIDNDRGYRNELRRANSIMRKYNLKNFIIPLHIDDLPFADIKIELARYIAAEFANGWAIGLSQLIDILEKEGVPKNQQYTRAAVTSWWRKQFSAEEGVLNRPEDYLSNWYAIENLPETIYFHELGKPGGGKVEIPQYLPYPAVQHDNRMVTFGKQEDFLQGFGKNLTIRASHQTDLQAFLEARIYGGGIARREAKNHFKQLLRIGWEQMIAKRGLPNYPLASGMQCFWFMDNLLEENKIVFEGIDGRQHYRKIVGKKGPYSWHFAVQAKPILYPTSMYIIKSHVLFTDAEGNLFNPDRMHRIRRSHCRNWHNADWRDRLLAIMSWLADSKPTIAIPLASDVSIDVANSPLEFASPVSYSDPGMDMEPPVASEDDYDILYDEQDEDYSEG